MRSDSRLLRTLPFRYHSPQPMAGIPVFESPSDKILRKLLRKEDLKEAVRLTSQEGWNQTEKDWLRLLELNADTCFHFQLGDRILGTATLAAYGSALAWVGMIIVGAPFRGRGFGRHILRTTLLEARRRGYRVVGLDATEQGRILYRRLGFHDVRPIDRWVGKAKPVSRPEETHSLDKTHLDDLLALDSEWSGVDRSRLLQTLFQEKDVQGWGLTRKHRLRGFTFLRPGRRFRHLGPLLAESEKDFATLLDAAAVDFEGEPVLMDALRRESSTKLLQERCMSVQRQLMRMTLDAPHAILSDPRLRLAVSFEWG